MGMELLIIVCSVYLSMAFPTVDIVYPDRIIHIPDVPESAATHIDTETGCIYSTSEIQTFPREMGIDPPVLPLETSTTSIPLERIPVEFGITNFNPSLNFEPFHSPLLPTSPSAPNSSFSKNAQMIAFQNLLKRFDEMCEKQINFRQALVDLQQNLSSL